MIKKILIAAALTALVSTASAKVDDACQFVWAKNYCLDGVWVEQPSMYKKLTPEEKEEYMKEMKPVLEAWSDASDAGDKVKEYKYFEKRQEIRGKWFKKLIDEKRM